MFRSLKVLIMKAVLALIILVVGLSGEALSMGHPHNIFAAHKRMKAKTTASAHKAVLKPVSVNCWEFVPHFNKAEFGKRLLQALAQV